MLDNQSFQPLHDLAFNYEGISDFLFQHLDARLPPGFTGVVGANGAGKTTLFNAITGDFPPTSGHITFFGEDITELPPHERIRKGLRRTYQSSLLFKELSVRDNLFLAVRGVGSGRFSFWPVMPIMLRPGTPPLRLAGSITSSA